MRRENHKKVFRRLSCNRIQEGRNAKPSDRRTFSQVHYDQECEQIFQGLGWFNRS